MVTKSEIKYQELMNVANTQKANFFMSDETSSYIKNIFSFLNKRDRLKTISINSRFKKIFESKVSLKVITLFLQSLFN